MAKRICPRCGGTGRVEDRRALLTPEDRNAIIGELVAGRFGIELAERYRVSPSTISRIRTSSHLADGRTH